MALLSYRQRPAASFLGPRSAGCSIDTDGLLREIGRMRFLGRSGRHVIPGGPPCLLPGYPAITLLWVFVCFRVLGRTYDAAVMSAGFVGFTLGATPTAMANMTAVTQRHGASHVAFLAVPLVGAFVIDLMNAMVIRIFLAVF